MIPFLDLKAQYASIRDDVREAVDRVMESGWYVLGPEVASFEEEFAAYCGTKYAVGVNSGTSALHLALLAAGVGPGDEVITVSHTFVATVAAVIYTGAKPVLVDISPVSQTMDPECAEKAVTSKTRVLLPVHLHGLPADMDPLREIAQRHNLVLIEDAAQAHGATYKNRCAGSLGDMGCFSFYPGKNLGACGEGGMVVTHNPQFAEALRLLRDWGAKRKYHHEFAGYNYRMEALQGAILKVKLRHLEKWTEQRRRLADRYNALLFQVDQVACPVEPEYARHVYHVYGIRTSERDALQQHLLNQGIQTGIHYPIPVHLQPAYADKVCIAASLETTVQATRELLSLPMYPELHEDQVREVVRSISDFFHV